MLKIYDGEIFRLEIDNFDAGRTMTNILENPDCYRMLFVLTKAGSVLAAASLADLMQNHIVMKTFVNNENVFCEARKFCIENNVRYGTFFPVLNALGDCVYLLWYIEEQIYVNSLSTGRKADLYFDDNLEVNWENLDYSLVAETDAYIFEELEEYTYVIAKILKSKYPYKSILFCDDKVKYFPEMMKYVQYIDKVDYVEFNRKSCMWIISNGRNYEECSNERFVKIYNSINVMNSMFWCSRRESYGAKNKGDTIFVIDFFGGNSGLCDYIKGVYSFYDVIKQRGWKIAIDLSKKPNQYLISESENMWDYFFEPLSDLKLEEVYESSSVIRASTNGLGKTSGLFLPYTRWYKETEVMKTIKFNRDTRRRICELLPEALKEDNHVLGVIIRGTDYRTEANNIRGRRMVLPSIEKMIAKCKFVMNLYGYQKIFIATEDLEYFQKVKEEFGEKCLYIDQKRVYHDYGGGYKPCSELLDIKDGKDFGRRYLAIIQSLANCKALLSNMNNGTAQVARWLNDFKYEYYEIVCP